MTSEALTETAKPSTRGSGAHVAGAQALARAAAAGDRAGVESLLASGAFVDAPLPNGETPLMRAAARGFEDLVSLLLGAGANASARRADGFTPLTLAAFFGHAGVARLLLEHGADASARTRLGTTARAWADARGFSEISALIEASASAPRRPSAAPQPAPGALLAAYAPEAGAARGVEGRPRAAESELRARAAEVSGVFGDKPSAADDAAEADAGPSGRPSPEAAPSSAEAATSGGLFGAEPFASTEAAQAGHTARPARSWQSVAGLLLLGLACTVAVYAAWRATRPDAGAGRQVVAPQQADGAQPVSPLPAAQSPSPQPSPGLTPLDPQALGAPGATDPGAFVPYTSGAPGALPPVTSSPGGPTSTPAVISEENRPAATDARRAGTEAGRDRNGAGETGGDESTRPPAAREGDSRPDSPRQTAAPPVISFPPPRPAPAPAEPAPSPTPGRKVIQWPPS